MPHTPLCGIPGALFSAVLQSDLSRLSEIDKSLAVFCMATYGEGDPTDNAQDFYDWLQEADADLSGLRFAVSQFVPVSAAFGQEKPKTLRCELLRSSFCCIWAAKAKNLPLCLHVAWVKAQHDACASSGCGPCCLCLHRYLQACICGLETQLPEPSLHSLNHEGSLAMPRRKQPSRHRV